MANILNEETRKVKAEEIRVKNLKPVNPNIKEYLGSEKQKENLFGGHKSHRDNIVPYVRNYHPEKKTAAENDNAEDINKAINKAINDEVNRSGVDDALAGYPPEISTDEILSHTEDIKEALRAEQKKRSENID